MGLQSQKGIDMINTAPKIQQQAEKFSDLT